MAALSPAKIPKVPDPLDIAHIPHGIDPVDMVNAGISSANNFSGTVSNVKKGVKFFSDPVRMGEALVGLVLIGIGINAALKGSPAGKTVQRGSGYARDTYQSRPSAVNARAAAADRQIVRQAGEQAARSAKRAEALKAAKTAIKMGAV